MYLYLALSLWGFSQVVLRIWKSTCLGVNMEKKKNTLGLGKVTQSLELLIPPAPERLETS